MGGILVFQIMESNNLIRNLENISSSFPNRLLKLHGYLLKNDSKEFLEIIIYKGFSSSTTHPIEIDSEKSVIKFNHYFTESFLYKAPLTNRSNEFLKGRESPICFLDEKEWI